MANDAKVAVVVGVGPGLGAALVRRFAREGFAVAMVARDGAKLAALGEGIRSNGSNVAEFEADTTDVASVGRAHAAIAAKLGPPDVLMYNAGAFQMGGILDVTPEQFEACWRANCLGGLLWAQKVLPAMLKRGHGTLLYTGATAALRGSAKFACLAVGKFGLRALAQSLAREFGPRGIHTAHVVIDGGIDTPRVRAMAGDRPADTLLSPDAIAETYWQLHAQHLSAWTHEIDVRPASEKF